MVYRLMVTAATPLVLVTTLANGPSRAHRHAPNRNAELTYQCTSRPAPVHAQGLSGGAILSAMRGARRPARTPRRQLYASLTIQRTFARGIAGQDHAARVSPCQGFSSTVRGCGPHSRPCPRPCWPAHRRARYLGRPHDRAPIASRSHDPLTPRGHQAAATGRRS
jgi:hypothetical protein